MLGTGGIGRKGRLMRNVQAGSRSRRQQHSHWDSEREPGSIHPAYTIAPTTALTEMQITAHAMMRAATTASSLATSYSATCPEELDGAHGMGTSSQAAGCPFSRRSMESMR